MKIVFSSYDSIKNPYYGGGGAIAIHEIAKRFALKNQVTVYSGNFPGSRNKNIDGVNYRYVGWIKWPRLGQISYLATIPFIVKRVQFDIWIENLTPPFSTSCLQLFTKKPVVALVQNLCALDMAKKYKLPFHLIEKIGLKTYRYFIVLTDYYRDVIQKINDRAQIVVTGNGINKSKFIANDAKVKNYLLYLGRIDIQQKGLDLLLKAYQKVVNQLNDDLYIAGNGDPVEERKLRLIIAKYGLTRRVKIIGKVNGKEKIKYIREAKFICQPSRFEGQSLVTLESIAAGKVVLCFAIPSLSWLKHYLSLKTPAFSVSRYAENIAKLSHDSKFRKSIENRLKKTDLVKSWDEVFQKYEKFCNFVVDQNHHRSPHKNRSIFKLIVSHINQSIYKIDTRTKPPRSPKKIGAYQLTKSLPDHAECKYARGIYSRRGKIYFIKTWSGKHRDYNLWLLQNEYLYNRILMKNMRLSTKKLSFNVAKTVGHYKTNHSYSVIYEYIKDKSLDSYPISFQAQIISDILDDLRRLSANFDSEDLKAFPRRGFRFYLGSFIFHVSLNLIMHPLSFIHDIKNTVRSLFYIHELSAQSFVLTHRDLVPENIMVANKNIYLIDCGGIILTYDKYDLTRLSTVRGLNKVYSQVSQMQNLKRCEFLKRYIDVSHKEYLINL